MSVWPRVATQTAKLAAQKAEQKAVAIAAETSVSSESLDNVAKVILKEGITCLKKM